MAGFGKCLRAISFGYAETVLRGSGFTVRNEEVQPELAVELIRFYEDENQLKYQWITEDNMTPGAGSQSLCLLSMLLTV